ncbi:MAG: hypothetical protein WA823_17815, partial [Candidatus Acidiferrales bacterium]
IDFMLCVVNLADYTRPIRGRILYNHLYFSDLPKAHKLAILQNRGYETILGHRNYSPRVIEYMTQSRHACAVAPSLYLAEFTDSLENPARIWDHAFRHQISEASRHALLVLSTLPDKVALADFEAAFWTFYRLRRDRFGFSTTSGDWQDALKQLDGSFISTRAVGKDIEVSFHSPSVRDFVEGFLAESEGDVADLISGAHFYEQYTSLWTGRSGHRYPGVDKSRNEFLRKLGSGLFGPSARTIRAVDHAGEAVGLNHYPPSNESRAEFVVRVANDLNNSAGDRFLNAVVEDLRKLWDDGHADKEDLVSLLDVLTKRGLESEDAVFVAAQKCLTLSKEFKVVDDFRAAARFFNKYPHAIGPAELGNIKGDFLEFATDYAVGWSDDDPDWLRQVASDLEFVAENLKVDVSNFTIALNEEADKIEREIAENEPSEDDRDDWEPSSYRDDVNDMFQSLKEELEG